MLTSTYYLEETLRKLKGFYANTKYIAQSFMSGAFLKSQVMLAKLYYLVSREA